MKEDILFLRSMLRPFGMIGTFLVFMPLAASAQYNIKNMMEEGRTSLRAGYYVASMQIFDRITKSKPILYEPWYLLALSKYHLEDYEGAEQDCTMAIHLNPYIPDILDLRAMSRIREEKYDSAAVDLTHAIELKPENQTYWFNRAYCYYYAGQDGLARQQLDYIISRWPDFAQARALVRDVKNGRKQSATKDKWIDSRRRHFVVSKESWQLAPAPKTNR